MSICSRLVPLALAALPLFGQGRPPEMDNDQVRVIRALDNPHNKTRPHEHKINRVMIYLQPARQEIATPDGKKNLIDVKAGDVCWSPAIGTHTSEILSETPVTIVEIELKKPAAGAKPITAPLDPVKVDPKDYKVEFENDQVRVIRVNIPAHGKVPMHEHTVNRVVVGISDQKTSATTAEGKASTSEHKAGEVSWAGPTRHSEENLLDHPFEAVVVELKN